MKPETKKKEKKKQGVFKKIDDWLKEKTTPKNQCACGCQKCK